MSKVQHLMRAHCPIFLWQLAFEQKRDGFWGGKSFGNAKEQVALPVHLYCKRDSRELLSEAYEEDMCDQERIGGLQSLMILYLGSLRKGAIESRKYCIRTHWASGATKSRWRPWLPQRGFRSPDPSAGTRCVEHRLSSRKHTVGLTARKCCGSLPRWPGWPRVVSVHTAQGKGSMSSSS